MCKKRHGHTVHKFGTIVNNRSIKQVKNKKKLLGKLWMKFKNNNTLFIKE